MRRRGFTIMELLMVAVVVGLLTAVAIAAINNYLGTIQLNAAADKLAADLRYAQTMANSEGRWYGVSFEVNPTNRYTLYVTNGVADTAADNPAKPGSSFVMVVNTDFGVVISSVNIAGGRKVEFSPLGTPYNDKLGLAITGEGAVTLTKSGSSRVVRIVPNTGRVYSQ